MCKLIDFRTNTNNIVKIADVKLKHIQNIVEQVKKCPSIEAIMLFGSSLEERCTKNSDIDIAIISKYTINKLCGIKSYNVFMDSVYNFDTSQDYDKLYFHSINDIYNSKNEAFIYKELRRKGKIIYRKGEASTRYYPTQVIRRDSIEKIINAVQVWHGGLAKQGIE